MAKTPKFAVPGVPGAFEPDAPYRVKLSRVVMHGRVTLRPCDDLVLKGKVAEQYRDAIVSAEKVD